MVPWTTSKRWPVSARPVPDVYCVSLSGAHFQISVLPSEPSARFAISPRLQAEGERSTSATVPSAIMLPEIALAWPSLTKA